MTQGTDWRARAEAAEAKVADALALHVKVEEPRHGCCASPRVCNGHAPECRSSEHRTGGVRWPCATVAALTGPTDPETSDA